MRTNNISDEEIIGYSAGRSVVERRLGWVEERTDRDPTFYVVSIGVFKTGTAIWNGNSD
jgi:hypothetical protein